MKKVLAISLLCFATWAVLIGAGYGFCLVVIRLMEAIGA